MRLHRIYTRSTRHLHRIDTFLPRVQRWSGAVRRGRTGPGLQPRRSGHCCPAGVYLPRTCTESPWSYARYSPSSQPSLYEFSLVKTAVSPIKGNIIRCAAGFKPPAYVCKRCSYNYPGCNMATYFPLPCRKTQIIRSARHSVWRPSTPLPHLTAGRRRGHQDPCGEADHAAAPTPGPIGPHIYTSPCLAWTSSTAADRVERKSTTRARGL